MRATASASRRSLSPSAAESFARRGYLLRHKGYTTPRFAST
jgi:hypothetical protein